MHVVENSYISLFAGVGGLDLGVRLAFQSAVCRCYVEINIEAAEVLEARISEGSMEDAPIWSNATTFPSELYRGRVAGVVAGWPCPPVSVAGKRKGTEDERWLWPAVVDIIRDTDAEWFLGENVPGLLSANDGGAFGDVLRDLAGLGMRTEWLCLRASDVGASHGRKRIFILAFRPGMPKPDILRSGSRRSECPGFEGRRALGESERKLADASRDERPGIEWEAGSRRGVCETGDELEHARRFGRDGGGQKAGQETVARCEHAGVTVDDATDSWRRPLSGSGDGRSEGPDGIGQADSGSGIAEPVLADAEHAERGAEQEVDGDAYGRTGPGRIGSELGDTNEPGLQGRRERGQSADERVVGAAGDSELANANGESGDVHGRKLAGIRMSTGTSPELPIFAPGPGATDLWQRILAEYPWLAPAISTEEVESTLRKLDARLADLVDLHRTDSLRAAGNGVTSLCAAVAFRILAKRARLTT